MRHISMRKKLSNKTAGIVLIIAAAIAAILLIYFIPRITSSGYDYLNYDKYISLGKYKGLSYTKQDTSVSSKEIKAEIDTRLKSAAATKEIKTGTVKKGDTVNIDYTGKIGKKTIPNGSAEKQDLVIGSNSFIPGFESGLIGKKVGSSATLNLTFPKNYTEKDLAGKKVAFTVKINSIKKQEIPSYNEAFIKKNSKYDNKADYEKYIRKGLEEQKKKTAESAENNELWSKIVTNAKIKKYPEKQLQAEKDRMTKQYKKIAKQYKMSWKKFLKKYMHTNEAGFNKQVNTSAKAACKQKLVAYAIKDKENIKFTKSDYKKELDKTLKSANFTRESFQKQYNESIEDYAEENDFRSEFVLEKVLKEIHNQATVKH